MSLTLSPGALFAGRYRITRALRSGGMGTVYEAVHTATNQRVALKTMRPEIVNSAQLQSRFAQEAQVSSIFQSKHVVRVMDAGVDGGVPFLVMEFLYGKELGDVLAATNTLPVGQTVVIMTQLAKGLDKAHAAGIIHRDLKPENLFLTRDEDGELVVKILDFGIAKLVQGVSNTTSAGGTPTYMAPEQTKKSNLTHAVDIWAFGLIAFRMLSGRNFWEADTIGELFGEILSGHYPLASQRSPLPLPEGFDAFFARCVALDPAARFASAMDAARAFAEIAGPPSSNMRDLALVLLGPEPSIRDPLSRVGHPEATQLAPSASGTIAAVPIETGAVGVAGATQLSAEASMPRVRPAPSKSTTGRRSSSRVVPFAIAGLVAAGIAVVAVTQLGGSGSKSAAAETEEDDEETSDEPRKKKSSKSASASSTVEASAPSASAPPSATAPAANPTIPTDKEWEEVPKEVALYGSSNLNCETKVLREWLRVWCRGTNDTGGTPTGIRIRKGESPGRTIVTQSPGSVTLLLIYEEGTDVEFSVDWTDKSAKVRTHWPRGAPRPKDCGNFVVEAHASPAPPGGVPLQSGGPGPKKPSDPSLEF